MRNDFFGEMAEIGGVPLNASPVRRWAGVFGHRPFAFSISMGIKNVLDDHKQGVLGSADALLD